MRVRPAHRDERRQRPRDEEWLLIEWPKDEVEPTKYWLSTLPAKTQIKDLVRTAKMRWRIERDYQELKQEFGLGHYEGRGWLGFHHHATLSIAAYGFLVGQRLTPGGAKKVRSIRGVCPTRGLHAARIWGRAQRHVPDSIATLRYSIACKLARRLPRCPGCARGALHS